MNFEDLKEWDNTQIIRPNNEWTGLYGIVSHVYKEIQLAQIFCVTKPCYQYDIRPDNIDDIRLIREV